MAAGRSDCAGLPVLRPGRDRPVRLPRIGPSTAREQPHRMAIGFRHPGGTCIDGLGLSARTTRRNRPMTVPPAAQYLPSYAGMPLIDFTSMKSLRPNTPPSRPLPDAL